MGVYGHVAVSDWPLPGTTCPRPSYDFLVVTSLAHILPPQVKDQRMVNPSRSLMRQVNDGPRIQFLFSFLIHWPWRSSAPLTRWWPMNEKKKRNCNRNCAATNLRLPFMVCYAQWRLHSSWILLFLLSPQLAKATTKWSQNVSCGERRPQSGEKENTNSSLLLFFLLVRPSLISYYLSLYSGLTREKIREERVCTHMCESVSDEIVAQISSCLSLFSFVLGDNPSLRSLNTCVCDHVI